jgi:hypothetical protein
MIRKITRTINRFLVATKLREGDKKFSSFVCSCVMAKKNLFCQLINSSADIIKLKHAGRHQVKNRLLLEK